MNECNRSERVGLRCRRCGKVIVGSESRARKLALVQRSSVVRLSAVRGRYHTTQAYECPFGNGWHIGRPRRES